MRRAARSIRPTVLAATALTLLGLAGTAAGAPGQGLPTTTWPAGTFLSHVRDGGRITTFHRGFLYMGGLARTTYYDISDPRTPRLVRALDRGENGHLWFKMGDLFERHYAIPELRGSSQRYLNLASLPDPVPWTAAAPLPIAADNVISTLQTFPHFYAGWDHGIWDMRSNQKIGTFDFGAQKGVASTLVLRIGNLWFYAGGDGGGGLSVFDVGDPAQPRLLDVLPGRFNQYTDAYQVWRNHIVLLSGDETNEGDNNLVAVDFSNPSDLRFAFGFKNSVITGARYAFFQDQHAFAAVNGRGVKVDMESGRVVQEFAPPAGAGNGSFNDFQSIPLGHLVMFSGSQTDGDSSYFFAHQDGLDRRPPTVGYHLPRHGATSQPPGTVVALVINETLDDTTVNASTIQLAPLGGAPVAADVVSSQHNVINFVPRQPLRPGTTYELRLVGGGIHDVAGNPIAAHSFRFSTGTTVELASAPAPLADAVNAPPRIVALSTNPPSPVLEAQTVTLTAAGQDPDAADGGALEYRWQFGDGSAQTEWSRDAATVTHTFAQPGNYTALAQTRDPQGNTAGHTVTLTVAASATAGEGVAQQDRRLRLRSTPIVVDAGARRVWSVNPDGDSVTVIDADQMTVLRELPVGRHPTSVAVDAQGRAWVTCRDSDEVRVLAGGDGAPVHTLALAPGARPVAVVLSPDGGTAYVAEHARGRVERFDAATFAATGAVSVGPTAQAMAISDDGRRLLVTRLISQGQSGTIWSIDLGSFAAATAIPLPLDTTSADSGLTARGLPNYVTGVALAPGGGRAFFAAKKDNVARGLARDGKPLTFETSIRALVSSVDPAAGAETVAGRIDLDDSSLPSAVAADPFGSKLLVTLQGNNRLVALDARTGAELARHDVGLAPQGVAIDPATYRVFTQDFLGRSVTVLDAAALIRSGARELRFLTMLTTTTRETLSPQVLQGKRLFYNAADRRMSLEGYISCASCHLDGAEDGRTWDFTHRGEGLRNTISLRGRAGTAQGPVHWSANFDEIQDFEHDIRTAFGGTGFLDDAQLAAGARAQPLGDPKAGLSADLDALAAYVASLAEVDPSPFRAPDGSHSAAAERGRAVFDRQGCATCHGGPGLTDSAAGVMHDVGTLKPSSGKRLGGPLAALDTPTLRGLWESAPYLHDGSAATVRDVLTDPASAAAHAGMDRLTPAEIDDLAAYLLEIDGEEGPRPAEPLVFVSFSRPITASTGELLVDVAVATPMRAVEVFVDGRSQGLAHPYAAGRYSLPLQRAPGQALTVSAVATHATGAVTRGAPVVMPGVLRGPSFALARR